MWVAKISIPITICECCGSEDKEIIAVIRDLYKRNRWGEPIPMSFECEDCAFDNWNIQGWIHLIGR